MATIRMKKGTLYADIFDSPESIASAQSKGYSIVKEDSIVKEEKKDEKKSSLFVKKSEEVVVESATETVEEKPHRGRKSK